MITTTCLILLIPPPPLDPAVEVVDLLADELGEQAAMVTAAAQQIATTENLRRACMRGRYARDRRL
jgi:hypothetical protein